MKRLPILPPMQCDPECGECCGVVPVTETEFHRIRRFAEERGIAAVDNGVMCPFLLADKMCGIYEARPLACRVFGHTTKMPCPKGYNVNLPEREIVHLIRSNGPPKHVLHELVPEFVENVEGHAARKAIASVLEARGR